jgi:hypothetical protein
MCLKLTLIGLMTGIRKSIIPEIYDGQDFINVDSVFCDLYC